MKIINSVSEWKMIRNNLNPEKTIGLFTTMGNLHEGHEHVLKRARQENDIVVLSIFVNATQFNDQKDYENYPRSLAADTEIAKNNHVDYLFIPAFEEMYPDHYTYQITETVKSQRMEGEFRPGHFSGMLTIVLKLLMLVNAHRTYFGEKDYQQLELVRGLVKAFFLDTEIVACETVREASGLPLSSRNRLLTPTEKKLAEQFSAIFTKMTLSTEEIMQQLDYLDIQVDYLAHYENRRFAAVKIGNVRLIDNYALGKE